MPKILDDPIPKLTEEARRQIRELGYSALNIRTVARNCGVGIGTVYNYFPSKEALVASVLAEEWIQNLSRMRMAARSGQAEAVLKVIYEELQDFAQKNRDIFCAAAESLPGIPRKYHAVLRSQLSEILKPLCQKDFTADFAAEALLTWTMEEKSFPEIFALLKKVLE